MDYRLNGISLFVLLITLNMFLFSHKMFFCLKSLSWYSEVDVNKRLKTSNIS